VTIGLATSLVATMLMAPVAATYAQDTAPAAGRTGTNSQPVATGAAAANGSQPAAGSQTPADQGQSAGSPSTGSPGGGGSGTGGSQPNAAKGSGKSSAVCFKLTGHCVEGSKGPAAKGTTASPAKDGSSAPRPLNLTAPDVRTVVSAAELKEPLPSDAQISEVQESETVSVKGESDAPDVPGGFGALWWALNHPSQAWRILAPAE
jgi:hypothetical protein